MSLAREEYESQIGGVLSHVWRREGERIVCDPADTATPLVELMELEDAKTPPQDLGYLPDDLSELRFMPRHKLAALVQRMAEELHDARKRALDTFFNYLFQDGPDPLKVLERLFIYCRAARRHLVWNMTLTEMAALFGHSKQNWQSKQERIIEDLVTRFSRSEFISSGGKSFAARLAYAKQRKGNKNRLLGHHADDDLPPLPPAEPDNMTLTGRAKARAKLMRDDAERRRLADICDCDPDEIDLNCILREEQLLKF